MLEPISCLSTKTQRIGGLNKMQLKLFLLVFASMSAACCYGQETTSVSTSSASPQASDSSSSAVAVDEEVEPWDYSPYNVLIWLVTDDPSMTAKQLDRPLRVFLDRDFASVWRVTIEDAPPAVRSAAKRQLESLEYDTLVASDPVIALKRDHDDAIRIRTIADLSEFCSAVYSTAGMIEDVKARAEGFGDGTLDGAVGLLKPIDGDATLMKAKWAEKETEALLVPRGLALTLEEPGARLMTPKIGQLVDSTVKQYDKIFIVRVDKQQVPKRVSATECETLMRHFGPMSSETFTDDEDVVEAIGHAITQAFAPVVRIEEAGTSTAVGLVRAAGLVTDPNSPALIKVNETLQPMVRKNDRNGKPILIGPMEWAYLYVSEPEVAVLRAAKDSGLQNGDVIQIVDDHVVENPQQIEQIIQGYDAPELQIHIDRKGADRTVKLNLRKNRSPIELQYTGFTVGIRRGEVAVRKVLPGSPAAGHLKVNDVLLAVGKTPITEPSMLGKLVASRGQANTIDLKIRREKEVMDISIGPKSLPMSKRPDDRTVFMDFYAGRAGGLQGRKNKRTFRIALRVRPPNENTLIRLHAKGNKNAPLIGYELYEKQLKTKKMDFVGRTDWNGRFLIDRKNERDLRLLYVKNGGAVLARLPVVPGFTPTEVADISGDDVRLRAEAYIRGVENAIVDLVAVRKLFEARIIMRLEEGEMEKANELMDLLRDQPSNSSLSNEMASRHSQFLQQKGVSANQKGKIDSMFKSTRDMLTTMITRRDIDKLEQAFVKARNNGGRLPRSTNEEEEIDDPTANDVTAGTEEESK